MTDTITQEWWLSARLFKACGEGTFTGMTDRRERQERAEAIILRHGLAEKPCGKRQGKEVTFGHMYHVIYLVPLKAAA